MWDHFKITFRFREPNISKAADNYVKYRLSIKKANKMHSRTNGSLIARRQSLTGNRECNIYLYFKSICLTYLQIVLYLYKYCAPFLMRKAVFFYYIDTHIFIIIILSQFAAGHRTLQFMPKSYYRLWTLLAIRQISIFLVMKRSHRIVDTYDLWIIIMIYRSVRYNTKKLKATLYYWIQYFLHLIRSRIAANTTNT